MLNKGDKGKGNERRRWEKRGRDYSVYTVYRDFSVYIYIITKNNHGWRRGVAEAGGGAAVNGQKEEEEDLHDDGVTVPSRNYQGSPPGVNPAISPPIRWGGGGRRDCWKLYDNKIKVNLLFCFYKE